jgi:putative oxidoreductase
MFHLSQFSDIALVLMRIMVGLIFVQSGYADLKNPGVRATSIGEPKNFTIFLGIAEVLGGFAVMFGFLIQLAAIGLILIMGGALQKKIFVWKTGFWGTTSNGWYYELTIVSMLLVIISTDGGRFILFG